MKCPNCDGEFTIYTAGQANCPYCTLPLGSDYAKDYEIKIEGQKSVADMMKQKRKTWKDKA